MSNIYYWEKLTLSKLRSPRKENWKRCTNLSRVVRGIFRLTFILVLSSSAVFRLQKWSQISFGLFPREIKGFYQGSTGSEVDFMDIMNVSPNILPKIKISKNLKFETQICRWKSNNCCGIIIFLPLKITFNFLLPKEKIWKNIFNTNSKLLQDGTEKKICHAKQQ